jgi:hypothetical protein
MVLWYGTELDISNKAFKEISFIFYNIKEYNLTKNDLEFIEKELNIELRKSYKKCVLRHPFKKKAYIMNQNNTIILDDAKVIVMVNKGLRKTGWGDKKWPDFFYCIGFELEEDSEDDISKVFFMDLDLECDVIFVIEEKITIDVDFYKSVDFEEDLISFMQKNVNSHSDFNPENILNLYHSKNIKKFAKTCIKNTKKMYKENPELWKVVKSNKELWERVE